MHKNLGINNKFKFFKMKYILLISYDLLNANSSDYDMLIEQIKLASSHNNLQKSVWLIYTTNTPDTWYNRLEKVVSLKDELFIADISECVLKNNYCGQARTKSKKWLNEFREKLIVDRKNS